MQLLVLKCAFGLQAAFCVMLLYMQVMGMLNA